MTNRRRTILAKKAFIITLLRNISVITPLLAHIVIKDQVRTSAYHNTQSANNFEKE